MSDALNLSKKSVLEMLPSYDDEVWRKIETEDNFGLVDDLRCDISMVRQWLQEQDDE